MPFLLAAATLWCPSTILNEPPDRITRTGGGSESIAAYFATRDSSRSFFMKTRSSTTASCGSFQRRLAVSRMAVEKSNWDLDMVGYFGRFLKLGKLPKRGRFNCRPIPRRKGKEYWHTAISCSGRRTGLGFHRDWLLIRILLSRR